MTMLVAWTLLLWVLLFAAGFRFVRRRKVLAAFTLVPALLIAVAIEFFAPPINGYDPVAARYWMSRAAAEPDAAAKEAYVRRVAFQSPEHGWFIAAQAIDSVQEPIQRCRLRTILAGLPGIRNRERLAMEAGEACNATITEGRGSP